MQDDESVTNDQDTRCLFQLVLNEEDVDDESCWIVSRTDKLRLQMTSIFFCAARNTYWIKDQTDASLPIAWI